MEYHSAETHPEKSKEVAGASPLEEQNTAIPSHYYLPPGLQRAKFNSKNLTQNDILQLQRTIGNQAVQRLLASRKAKVPVPIIQSSSSIKNPGAQPEVVTPAISRTAIQRKFGMELELRVFISEKIKQEEAPGSYADPGLDKTDKIYNNPESGLHIVTDHTNAPLTGEPSEGIRYEEHLPLTPEEISAKNKSRLGFVPSTAQGRDFTVKGTDQKRTTEVRPEKGYSSIIEMVTRPIDEYAEEWEQAKVPIEKAKSLADAIYKETNNLKERKKLSEVIPGARDGNLYLGINDPDGQIQSTTADIQITMGVKLGGIPKLFKQKDAKGFRISPEMSEANAVVSKLMTRLIFDYEGKAKPDNSYANLEGLLNLAAMYLRCGRSASADALDKNVVSMLVRHDFSTVFSTLQNHEQDLLKAPGKKPNITSNKSLKTYITDTLLQDLGRVSGELVFKEKGLKSYPGPMSQAENQEQCGSWLDKVLTGQPENLYKWFEELKHIPEEDVGPTNKGRVKAPVMENRGTNTVLLPPAEWIATAKDTYDRLRDVNQ